MTEIEKAALLAEVGTQAKAAVKGVVSDALKTEIADITNKAAAAAKTAAEDAVKNGGIVGKEAFETYQTANADAMKKLEDIAKTQGIALELIQKEGVGNIAKSAFDVMKTAFEEATDEIKSVISKKGGSVELKNVINIGGISAGNSQSGTAIPASITGTGSVRETVDGVEMYTRARSKPVLMDFVNVKPSSRDKTIVYFEENNRTGLFQLTAEGGLKPFAGYSATKVTKDYKKVTGRAPFTEEFMLDFSLLYSIFIELMKIDCDNDMDDVLMTTAITDAAPYLNPSMFQKVDQADNYGAIGAAIVQMQLANYEPDVLVLSPVDAMIMNLEKGTTGYYVLPPSILGGNQFGANQLSRVITSNKVIPGNFFLANAMAYQVVIKTVPELRIGYAADTNDWARNQMSVIVEKYFYNFIPVNKRPAFIYANFNAVITSIEKP